MIVLKQPFEQDINLKFNYLAEFVQRNTSEGAGRQKLDCVKTIESMLQAFKNGQLALTKANYDRLEKCLLPIIKSNDHYQNQKDLNLLLVALEQAFHSDKYILNRGCDFDSDKERFKAEYEYEFKIMEYYAGNAFYLMKGCLCDASEVITSVYFLYKKNFLEFMTPARIGYKSVLK